MGKAPKGNNDSANHNHLNEAHRPRFLLSGLLRCGCCNGPYAIIGRDRYACSTRKQKGTCDNTLTITRQEVEARVLEGLKERLLAPDLVKVFVSAFRDESKLQRDALQAEWASRERKAAELDRKIASIFRAIEDGLYEPAMKARLVELKELSTFSCTRSSPRATGTGSNAWSGSSKDPNTRRPARSCDR